MLRDFARQLLAAALKTDQTAMSATPIGTITAISQLPTPYYGEVEGIGRVTITADANMVGFSPVRLCVDDDDELAWVPLDRIRNRDARLRPIGAETRPSSAGSVTTTAVRPRASHHRSKKVTPAA